MQFPVLDNLLLKNSSGLPVKDFLQQLVQEYPFYTPAHFFLLQQLAETEAGYEQQAAKTALLFNNPYWLHFQLQQTQQAAPAKPTPVIAMYENNTVNSASITEHEDANHAALSNNTESCTNGSKITTTAIQTVEVEDLNTDNDDDNAELVAAHENPKPVTFISKAEIGVNLGPAENNITDAAQKEDNENLNADNDDDNAVIISETVTSAEETPKIDLAGSIKSAENEHAPAFEPMHLVDYFASQGIKLSDEVLTTDKLGKQLKSFTEWLKTMKKIHTPTPTEGTDVAVQAMAEKSNVENEVVTEAMAEVFNQQGKTAKAIELYEKLSLLNPLKSAYFAAQIKKLKEE
jgi:hypothetical protein